MGARPRRGRARMIVIAALPREGAIARQCRRCFVANDFGPVSSALLRQWAYPGQPRKHWHHWSIVRSLRRLGAHPIGRANGRGRPVIWAIKGQ
jgi:hypothetical protein